VRAHDPALLPGGALVAFAPTPVDEGDVYLYHKCTDRSRYEAALASAPGMFDVLLWNGDREATELTRGNLVVELDGKRFTPPVGCGLLSGVLRGELLERGDLAERVLTLDDVRAAERLWFVNSLRGLVPITLVYRDPGAAGESGG
jgi:para-aminobenzoate synthetase / 4-amino-4-deoxychorismate lyase